MAFGDHAANIRWDNDTNPGGPTKRKGEAKGMAEWGELCNAAAQGLPTFNALATIYWPAFWSQLTAEERETYWVALKRLGRVA
jgi:hypothetical protein